MKNSVLCVVFYLFVISTDVTVTGKYAAATNDALNFFTANHTKMNSAAHQRHSAAYRRHSAIINYFGRLNRSS